jgi:hypothetical protein
MRRMNEKVSFPAVVAVLIACAAILAFDGPEAHAQGQAYPAGNTCNATACTTKTLTTTSSANVKDDATLTNSTSGKPLKVSDDDGLAVACVAALATCNAAHKGSLLMVCGTTRYHYCDGSAWQEFVPLSRNVTAFGGYVYTGAVDTGVTTYVSPNGGTVRAIQFTTMGAGAGAGTGALDVINTADDEILCSLAVDCDAADGTIASITSCTGAFAAGNGLQLKWNAATACAVIPAGNAVVTVRE